jgi:hypothetical protein
MNEGFLRFAAVWVEVRKSACLIWSVEATIADAKVTADVHPCTVPEYVSTLERLLG